MEACSMFHPKRGSKNGAGGHVARGGAKAAICAEFPEHLKIPTAFFGFSEVDFRIKSPSEAKKLRLRLSVEKERKERQIQREREIGNLVELLDAGGLPADDEVIVKSLEENNAKQIKTLCASLCSKHYASV